MLNRLRKALVKSYVGAIALGWLFAQGILHFAYVFSAPVTGWLMRREYRPLADRSIAGARFSVQDALPELVKCFSLLLIGYFLLRWLYFKPVEEETLESNAEQGS